jgi:hypothetical protein
VRVSVIAAAAPVAASMLRRVNAMTRPPLTGYDLCGSSAAS